MLRFAEDSVCFQVISNTPKFLHMAITSESVIDPHQHECLKALPSIFFKAMRGISVLVDAFLGSDFILYLHFLSTKMSKLLEK